MNTASTIPAEMDPGPSPSATWRGVGLLVITLFAYYPILDAGFVWNDDDLSTILALIDQGGLSAVWFSSSSYT